jgi:hypothetical protein
VDDIIPVSNALSRDFIRFFIFIAAMRNAPTPFHPRCRWLARGFSYHVPSLLRASHHNPPIGLTRRFDSLKSIPSPRQFTPSPDESFPFGNSKSPFSLLYLYGASSVGGPASRKAGYYVSHRRPTGIKVTRSLPPGTPILRVELHALIAALRFIAKDTYVGGWVIACHSDDLVDNVTESLSGWVENAWCTDVGRRDLVEHVDLWQTVLRGLGGVRNEILFWRVNSLPLGEQWRAEFTSPAWGRSRGDYARYRAPEDRSGGRSAGRGDHAGHSASGGLSGRGRFEDDGARAEDQVSAKRFGGKPYESGLTGGAGGFIRRTYGYGGGGR